MEVLLRMAGDDEVLGTSRGPTVEDGERSEECSEDPSPLGRSLACIFGEGGGFEPGRLPVDAGGRFPAFLRSRSFRDAILDGKTGLADLVAIRELGEDLENSHESPGMRVLGRALRILAPAAARARRLGGFESFCIEDLKRGIAFLERFGGLDRELRALCIEAHKTLLDEDPSSLFGEMEDLGGDRR